MHILLTGHTGFKGSWFLLMLRALGHRVSGLALDPLPGSLFHRGSLSDVLVHDVRADIRNQELLVKTISDIRPDFVIHFAAQALVKEGYKSPRFTFETNVNGTLNLLEATQNLDSLQGRLIITSDKVYLNDGRLEGYKEEDPLGGRDPYSASKAMADILTQSWIHSFAGPRTAIARAGNVIGGGDVSPHRLVPDLVQSFRKKEPITLRYPNAVRPWQHVLDCLSGYLSIIDHIMSSSHITCWNVGPTPSSIGPVRALVDQFSSNWGSPAEILHETGPVEHEEGVLTLDSSKLRENTGWHDKLDVPGTIKWTVDWEKKVLSGSDVRGVTEEQIDAFLAL